MRPSLFLAVLLVISAGIPSSALTAAKPPEVDLTVLLAPRRTAILSAEVSAKVMQFHRDFGQSFAREDLLISLDNTVYQENSQRAQVTLTEAMAGFKIADQIFQEKAYQKKAAAQLRQVEAELTRVQSLFKDNDASQSDLEKAKANLAFSEADVIFSEATATRERDDELAKMEIARVDQARANRELSACSVKAPFAGRVVKRHCNEHELIERGQPLLEIIDDSVLRARILIPSASFRQIRKGMQGPIRILETDTIVTATVVHLGATIDATSESFEVYAEIDNHEGALRAGMNARLILSDLKVKEDE